MAESRSILLNQLLSASPVAGRVFQRLPGNAAMAKGAQIAEEALLRGLFERMGEFADGVQAIPESLADVAEPSDELSSRQLMASLLNRAAEQKLADAQEALYQSVLQSIVPDQARIMAALSDGSTHALLHVAAGPPVGPVLRRELANVSNVGKAASVMLLERVPEYISHLIHLGVLETGPEDAELEIKYEVLMGDTRVREAGKKVEKDYRFPARYLRRTIGLSPMGMSLWQHCLQPPD